MKLRSYQESIYKQVINSPDNLLVQLDTGAGKTPIIAQLAKHYRQAIIVCHRNILIKQASEKLALCDVVHRIIASRTTKKICANNNLNKCGQHYINPRSTILLVSIDSFNSQFKQNKLSIDTANEYITLIDEAHHLAEDNKWDTLNKVIKGRVIGFTATPIRGDNQPLISDFGGYFKNIIQAKGYEDGTERLISEGYLAPYKAYYAHTETRKTCTRNELKLSATPLEIYNQYCHHKQAIVILPRILNAIKETERFQNNNIKADIIHSGLPQYQIERVLEAFDKKQIKVLVAVDMISEGFDVPDCDALILCRDIKSFGLFRQLCGRVLRPRPGKQALILDATGNNIVRHGLPSDPVNWYQKQTVAKRKTTAFCFMCYHFYEITHAYCPNCGTEKNAKLTGLGVLNINYFRGVFQEQKRQEIAYTKQLQLKQQTIEDQAKLFNTTYLDTNISFQKNVIGARLNYLFTHLKQTLKQHVTCYDYNLFFTCYHTSFQDMNFYSKHITSKFNTNIEAQCKALYEAKRNDLPNKTMFQHCQTLKR